MPFLSRHQHGGVSGRQEDGAAAGEPAEVSAAPGGHTPGAQVNRGCASRDRILSNPDELSICTNGRIVNRIISHNKIPTKIQYNYLIHFPP